MINRRKKHTKTTFKKLSNCFINNYLKNNDIDLKNESCSGENQNSAFFTDRWCFYTVFGDVNLTVSRILRSFFFNAC